MREGADARVQDVALEAPLGAKVSSKWVLQFKGDVRKATLRADNFVEQLHGQGGWRDGMMQLPSGGTERVYICPDKLADMRTETHAR